MGDALASPPAFSADSPLAAGWEGGKGRFLIDGFPRKLDQAHEFDRSVRCAAGTLVLRRLHLMQIRIGRSASRPLCSSFRAPRRSCSSASPSAARRRAGKTTTMIAFSSDSVRRFSLCCSRTQPHSRSQHIGTFVETSMPVVDEYRSKDKVVEVSGRRISRSSKARPAHILAPSDRCKRHQGRRVRQGPGRGRSGTRVQGTSIDGQEFLVVTSTGR